MVKSISTENLNRNGNSNGNGNDQVQEVQWSDIDKVRFYGIGTAMYSAITICLHPITVLKTRQQVLSSKEAIDVKVHNGHGYGGNESSGRGRGRASASASASSALAPSSSLSTSTLTSSSPSSSKNLFKIKLNHLNQTIRTYYRGIGIVLVSAIPARGIYIGVLENSKEHISSMLRKSLQSQSYNEREREQEQQRMLPLIASISGGISGGLAAMASQAVIVPMDVISQRQMVMTSTLYDKEGGVFNIIKNVIENDGGYRGFYRGFGMSLFTSLPTGTLWWATYSGVQQKLQNVHYFQYIHENDYELDSYSTSSGGQCLETYMKELIHRGLVQGISGLSAAVVAATLTQPLDVVKTRLQVGSYGTSTMRNQKNSSTTSYSYASVIKELHSSSGFRGFFRGTMPRITTMTIWGTVLSAAYEYLRHISRKDYNFSGTWIENTNASSGSKQRFS